ncbi:AbrB family transcriptional regulator [Aliishimia ponticola]|nr:AbrB family transcriptional regulator [Aliishimia ponticola]
MLAIGLLGALLARVAGIPMPYLTGALASVGVFSIWRSATGRSELQFPKRPRQLFVGLIGVMIGASFTADLVARLPGIWPSLLVMTAFVLVAMGMGYALFRVLGGYDPVTAVYSAMPGGLVEAVTLGEEAGGNVRILALQHFARIVVVVVAVPTLYFIWSGHAVGSAAGQSFTQAGWTLFDVAELVLLAIAGMWLGPKLRLPAAHLVGPLLLSAGLHGAGLLHLAGPAWLLAVSQLVVGTALGTSFSGANRRDLLRAFGLGSLYVLLVLGVAFGIATGLAPILPFDFDTLFVSFAPGGVTEMGLIALSLGISPVVVTAHHIFRIGLTVTLAGVLSRRLRARA